MQKRNRRVIRTGLLVAVMAAMVFVAGNTTKAATKLDSCEIEVCDTSSAIKVAQDIITVNRGGQIWVE